MKLKTFQKQDLARAALHDGLILSWDTGLGKTWALFLWSLLKVGFIKLEDGTLRPKGPVLIIAPGDLHQQITDEGRHRFKVAAISLDSQDKFAQLTRCPNSPLTNLTADGRPILPPGFYITSYTQLATNGVPSLPDAEDWDNPLALQQLLCLPTGEHVPPVRPGDEIPGPKGAFKRVRSWADRPDLLTACDFFAWRALRWSKAFSRLNLDPDDTFEDLQANLRSQLELLQFARDQRHADKERTNLQEDFDLLKNLVTAKRSPRLADLSPEQQAFVIRAFCADRLEAYAKNIGEIREYGDKPKAATALVQVNGTSIPEPATAATPPAPAAPPYRIKCVSYPSLADLSYRAFDAVVIDEGVKMKGEETLVGKGVRSMQPKFRLVLTATPVKNRLPDIFRLAWWATGGQAEAHARFPYRDDTSERTRFAETFMVSERNVTKEEKARERGEATSSGRFKKLTPEVCNVHRLWKLLGPIVLRRRKQDAGEDIVPRVRKVIRCEMGTLQQKVYRHHLETKYVDKNGMEAIGAQLQALRMAAADPSSEHLQPQIGVPSEPCPDCNPQPGPQPTQSESAGSAIPHSAFRIPHSSECPRCQGARRVPLPVRSGQAYIPKMATTLTLVQEILQRKEQVVVFSAFNDPLDNLGRWLDEASVRYVKLDGRVSQKKRGSLASLFKRGRTFPQPSTLNAPPELPIPVMLAGVECMAEGHSFHLANNVILISYSWAYDKFKQALDRVHRMTSQKPVNVYVVLCDGTIDRKLESLVQDKGDAAELVLDGRLIGERQEEVNLAELLNVAHREFDAKTKTIDESLLHAQWIQPGGLRDSLDAAMRAWDDAPAGVPVATELCAPAAASVRIPPVESTPPSTLKPQPSWRQRLAFNATRLARASKADLWSQL